MLLKVLIGSLNSSVQIQISTFIYFQTVLILFPAHIPNIPIFMVLLTQPNQQPKTTYNNFCWGGIIIGKKKPHHHHTTTPHHHVITFKAIQGNQGS